MQEKALEFIDLLEEKQLLAPEIVEELRRQVAETSSRLTPELLGKLLVDNGHLTKYQATRLVAESKERQREQGSDKATSTGNQSGSAGGSAAPASQPGDQLQLASDADELELAPVEDDEPAKEKASQAVEASDDGDEDAAEVAAIFIEDAGEGDADVIVSVDPSEPNAAEVIEPNAAELIDVVEAEEAVAEVLELPDDSAAEATEIDVFADSPKRPQRPVKKKIVEKDPWGSYRILGRAVILSLLLIALVLLVFYFWRGSADEHLQRADDMYEARSYETAATLYEDFVENWPTHEKASYAKVRAVLAQLRAATELAPDPLIGLQRALELVPGLAGESGLPEQQSDLAGVLINLAEKFNERADKTADTSKRKELMKEMEKLLELINNPQFVGPTQRSQYAPTLQRVAEDRQRILREILRDEELQRALAEIDKLLDANETLKAYQVRAKLIDTYPLLEANPELIKRVHRATEILRDSVRSATLPVQRADTPPTRGPEQVFVLAHRRGKTIPEMARQVLFYRVGGAVFGLDGSSGEVKWRHFLGSGLQKQPLPIDATDGIDCLAFVEEPGQLLRIDARSGQSEWFVQIGTKITEPLLEGDDLYVATHDGIVAAFDVVSGQLRWSKQLPQPVTVSPGTAAGKPYLYVLGEHSNLYVLSRLDGSCKQVVYTGHRPDAIKVRPIISLGLLFLFENISAETGSIRILQTTEEGVAEKDVQLPIPVDGNVVLPPTLASRRMIVHSDLGQILALDIEPTEEKEKVLVAAKIPKNLLTPQLSWSVFDNNVLWVANSRLSRFNYQVALGKLDREWIKNEGDLFLAALRKFDDVIVHLRRVRGNLGARVAAVDAQTGDAIWETDLAVPVVWLEDAADGVEAINSSALLFRSVSEPLVTGADVDAGNGKPQLALQHPVTLSSDAVVLHNQSRPNQIALFSKSETPPLRTLLVSFGTGRPTAPPAAVGDLVAFGLNNGQLVLIDPANGSQVSTPYQVPMKPGRVVQWNRPAYLSDSQTMIVGNSLQKLVRLSTDGGLRLLNEVHLEYPLDGPLVLSEGRLFAVAAAQQGDQVQVFDPISLEFGARVPLTGRRLAGPFPMPGGVLVQTNSQLVAIDPQGKIRWKIDAPLQAVVDRPIVLNDSLFIASADGKLWRLRIADGSRTGMYDVQQNISAAPVVSRTGDALLIGSQEGTVLVVPLDDFETQQ